MPFDAPVVPEEYTIIAGRLGSYSGTVKFVPLPCFRKSFQAVVLGTVLDFLRSFTITPRELTAAQETTFLTAVLGITFSTRP